MTIGTGWHTIAVEAIGTSFTCFLDGQEKFTAYPAYDWQDGLVGLWVQTGTAMFDNVKVVDLRYP